MRTSVKHIHLGLFLLLQCLWASTAVHAQAGDAYPNKPIKLIIPVPTGSTTDGVSRFVALELGKSLGEAVVIDNRAGAGGILAAETVARAKPDGYSLLVANQSILTVIPFLAEKVRYNPTKDYEPISMLAENPNILVIHPSVPATTVKELLAYARANPGVLNYGSTGNGTAAHLSGHLFGSLGKVNIVHIPYKSGNKEDLMAGRLQMLFTGFPAMLPEVKSGRLRVLGLSSTKRNELLPNVPTISESGLPGFDVSPWIGMLAPAKTPAPIVKRINSSLVEILGNDALQKKFRNIGVELTSSTPEAFSAFIASEAVKWAAVVKDAGLDVEK